MPHFGVEIVGLLRVEETGGCRIERPQRKLEHEEGQAERGAHKSETGRDGPQSHRLTTCTRATVFCSLIPSSVVTTCPIVSVFERLKLRIEIDQEKEVRYLRKHGRPGTDLAPRRP